MKQLAVYIHWPFCVSKCPYCDFNSRRLPNSIEEEKWSEAYLAEIKTYADLLPDRTIGSIYFGGGTPSLMAPQTVQNVLNAISRHWRLSRNCEITLEANPSSSEIDKFKEFRTAGINRLSLGVQSLDDTALKFLGRAHDAAMARRAIEMAATVFDRFSFDLIYGRAGQTEASWQDELHEALAFNPKHLSLYQLTIEPGTIFYKKAQTETLQVDEESACLLYDQTNETMMTAGLPPYEVSNYAAPGQESRHNLTYWHYEDYIGIGPGAHGRFCAGEKRWATENKASPSNWLSDVGARGRGIEIEEEIDIDTAQKEALLMGLRLVRGIDSKKWGQRFGETLENYIGQQQAKILEHEGLMKAEDGFVSATKEGRKKLNAIIEFIHRNQNKTTQR